MCAKKNGVEPLKVSDPDPELVQLVGNVHTAREMKRSGEAMEKENLDKIKDRLNELCDSHPENEGRLAIPDMGRGVSWGVVRQVGVTKTINADQLMGRGVAPDVIAACTVETRYFKYMIKPTDL